MVLGGDAKKEFEELTIRLCGQKLEGDKAEQVMAKLRRKADTTWPKVGDHGDLAFQQSTYWFLEQAIYDAV